MFRRSRNVVRRRLLIICIIISCFTSFLHFLLIPSSDDEQVSEHLSIIYNVSDSFMMTNIIDQFLDSKNNEERDKLWSILVQSWSNSFQIYLEKTKTLCSLSISSVNFIQKYLNQYTTKLLLDNTDLQRHLTGFGLFFYYNFEIMRSKDHHILHNIFLSPCLYFELIILIMKVQFVLFDLNINYFIGQNTLIGAQRHHDIVPWHSIVEFNLPLNSKTKFIDNINRTFQLELQKVNDTSIQEKQIGFIYKVSIAKQTWPQIEIYFYQENSNEIFDSYDHDKSNIKIGSLRKNDIFPFHLRPFGPILLWSIQNPQAMISRRKLNVCENMPWNHQLEKETAIDRRWRIPCEQLTTVYSFVQLRHSWRRGYCEETIKTTSNTLSYFRYTCQENMTHQLR